MTNPICFSIEYKERIVSGRNVITDDNSIVFETDDSVGSFSIHPYDWSFEITVEHNTLNRGRLQYALGSVCLQNAKRASLSIPASQQGRVYVNMNFPDADGIYYSDFSPFLNSMFYDKNCGIFAVGDVSFDRGVCVEFAEDQFIVLTETGELKAIYVQLS